MKSTYVIETKALCGAYTSSINLTEIARNQDKQDKS